MSQLLDMPPFGLRDDLVFLEEINSLTRHHLEGCPLYARVWPDWSVANAVEEVPYLHVGTFKLLDFKTEGIGIKHQRTLKSSATTSGVPSRLHLDARSSRLQARSAEAILENFLGKERRPLLVVDGVSSLRTPGETPARVAAALSLQPLSTDIYFLLEDAEEPESMKWDTLADAAASSDALFVYGSTAILWLAWGAAAVPERIRDALSGRRIDFVHSGGWKKLAGLNIERHQFDAALVSGLHPDSRVLDYYGLAEQVGVIYPLCEDSRRHVPVWGAVVVRDPLTLEPLEGKVGQLQLMNTTAFGAPYHSVLTEDLGSISRDPCRCGRSGSHFELLGRIPQAEVRGCATV